MKRPRGFSLLEMMAVVAILGILAGLAGPVLTSSMRRRKLNQLARQVASIIYQARSTAIAKRKKVQVGFGSGYVNAFTRSDSKVFARYPAASNEYFDRSVAISTTDNRLFIDANGATTDGNGHPLDGQILSIVDSNTGETINLTVKYSGGIAWK